MTSEISISYSSVSMNGVGKLFGQEGVSTSPITYNLEYNLDKASEVRKDPHDAERRFLFGVVAARSYQTAMDLMSEDPEVQLLNERQKDQGSWGSNMADASFFRFVDTVGRRMSGVFVRAAYQEIHRIQNFSPSHPAREAYERLSTLLPTSGLRLPDINNQYIKTKIGGNFKNEIDTTTDLFPTAALILLSYGENPTIKNVIQTVRNSFSDVINGLASLDETQSAAVRKLITFKPVAGRAFHNPEAFQASSHGGLEIAPSIWTQAGVERRRDSSQDIPSCSAKVGARVLDPFLDRPLEDPNVLLGVFNRQLGLIAA